MSKDDDNVAVQDFITQDLPIRNNHATTLSYLKALRHWLEDRLSKVNVKINTIDDDIIVQD